MITSHCVQRARCIPGRIVIAQHGRFGSLATYRSLEFVGADGSYGRPVIGALSHQLTVSQRYLPVANGRFLQV